MNKEQNKSVHFKSDNFVDKNVSSVNKNIIHKSILKNRFTPSYTEIPIYKMYYSDDDTDTDTDTDVVLYDNTSTNHQSSYKSRRHTYSGIIKKKLYNKPLPLTITNAFNYINPSSPKLFPSSK